MVTGFINCKVQKELKMSGWFNFRDSYIANYMNVGNHCNSDASQ